VSKVLEFKANKFIFLILLADFCFVLSKKKKKHLILIIFETIRRHVASQINVS